MGKGRRACPELAEGTKDEGRSNHSSLRQAQGRLFVPSASSGQALRPFGKLRAGSSSLRQAQGRLFVPLWTLGLALALGLMLASYAVALNAYWVGDDYNYIRPKGWETVFNFFNPVGRAVYRPFTHGIWAADFTLFGDEPLGWRLTRLAIHSLNIVWVALLVRALTGRRTVALLAAALFAVHPAHTETVTWMGGQADINFALFWLPALLLFVRWRQGAGRGAWLLAGLLGALSMFGKEAAITLPLASLWIDIMFGRAWARWPGRRDKGWWREPGLWLRLLRDHSLFIATSALYVAMRLYLYFTEQGFLMYGVEEQLQFFNRAIDNLAGYILLATGAWWLPQEIVLWPLLPKLLIIGAGLLLIIALVRWLGRVALFAVGWSALTLLLTSQAVASRWFYIPSLGVCILIACAWSRLRDKSKAMGQGRVAVAWRWASAALPVLILLWWGGLTATYNEVWRQSGEVARDILAQVQTLHPNPQRPATFYIANPPPTYRGALLFNSGFAPAVQVAYRDYTGIKSYNLAEPPGLAQVKEALQDPTKIGPNPIFLRYEGGSIREYPSLQALYAADGR